MACNQVIVEGAVLVRNILLARLLGPDQMGIAVMLAIALRCLEMVSYLAADRLLVQARDGNSRLFQANAHGLEVIRGIISGFALAVFAYPTAIAFGHPEIAWAFAALGMVPALRGFMHLDYRRLQRRFRFGQTIKVESIASIVGTAAVWPAVRWTGDFSALLWVSLVQALVHVVISHFVARRPYNVRLDRGYLKRILRFGWPLLLNSLVMFGVFQGDRIIVALAVSPADLARYALALQLGLLPTLILARASLSLLLPLLARVQDAPVEFQRRYRQTEGVLFIASIVFVAVYVAGGNYVIAVFFGESFAITPIVLSCLGGALALRIFRIGPSTAALAIGDSRTLMHANLWRVSGLLLAAWAGIIGAGLPVISAAAVLGELSALLAGNLFLHRRHRIETPLPRTVLTLTAIGVVTAWPWLPALFTAVTIGVILLTIGLWYRADSGTRGSRLGIIQ